MDYEKEAEERFQKADYALEELLRLTAELEARLSERNVEASLSLTSSLTEKTTEVRGLLSAIKMVKTALGIPSSPPPPIRRSRGSSTRTKVVAPPSGGEGDPSRRENPVQPLRLDSETADDLPTRIALDEELQSPLHGTGVAQGTRKR